MNRSDMSEISEKANKLVIRSEVLSIIRHLSTLEEPSKQERFKQIKRLREINNSNHVMDILVKELQRCNTPEILTLLIEILMEIGTIDYLQDKLWSIIRDQKTSDEVKDAANLILRHLGDTNDPNLYLEYLADPEGLIGRETTRMLEISTENPEALIDFLDFIVSLGTEDQIRLLETLHTDYPSEYLVNVYVPILESDPPPEIWEHVVSMLGETKSSIAYEALSRFDLWQDERLPIPKKLITKSLKKLQLAGACRKQDEELIVLPDKPHTLSKNTIVYQCFTTVYDGIGNQGIVLSRQRLNGDVALVSVAINDMHGIIDCFGFFQLSMGDFCKIIEKFHEGSTKIKVSPEYCVYKFMQAQALNYEYSFRLPYEYRCWMPLWEDIQPLTTTDLEICKNWVRTEWYLETDNLYQHPDFNSWFLEQGDEPSVTRILQKVIILTEKYLQQEKFPMEDYFIQLETMADTMSLSLLKTSWRELMINRLYDAAYLLNCQNTHTFRNLAATEAYKLQNVKDPRNLLTGFTKAYGRRCISEELLRLRTGNASYGQLSEIVDNLLVHWKL